MFRRKKKRDYKDFKDPIVAKLREAFPSEGEAVPGVPTFTEDEYAEMLSRGPLHLRNAKWASEQPEARFETLEFVGSDDDKVLNFLAELGFDPKTIQKGTITFEAGQPLVIDLKTYALDKVTYGSTYKAWEPGS